MKIFGSALAIGLLAAGSALLGAPSDPVSGYWTGTLEDKRSLRMYLVEVSPDSVTGWVVMDSGLRVDSLEVRQGRHLPADSLYLDVSNIVGPPIGCTQMLEGALDASNRVAGDFKGRCGHDPAFSLGWSATRGPIAVHPVTWAAVKRAYVVVPNEGR